MILQLRDGIVSSPNDPQEAALFEHIFGSPTISLTEFNTKKFLFGIHEINTDKILFEQDLLKCRNCGAPVKTDINDKYFVICSNCNTAYNSYVRRNVY